MIALLAAILLKGSMLMAAGGAFVLLTLRASAATRHFIWTLTVVGLLALPVFSTMMPAWEMAVPVASFETSAVTDITRIVGTRPATARVSAAADLIGDPSGAVESWPTPALLVAFYIAGVLILTSRIVIHRSAARRLVRDAIPVSDREWISLLDRDAHSINRDSRGCGRLGGRSPPSRAAP
jgi:hypothetical protein